MYLCFEWMATTKKTKNCYRHHAYDSLIYIAVNDIIFTNKQDSITCV